jgi:peptidyl-prolyl cis-trans isomerase SurA
MPTGDTALNILGFSTQVPMNAVYITNGAKRKVQVGERNIIFKNVVQKNFQFKGKLLPLIIIALKELGENQVTDEIKDKISKLLSESDAEERATMMQIFKRLPQTITSRHLEEEKTRMDSIYRMIQNQPDLNFNRLVEIYSDDKQSRWIECLETTSEFENVAFSLAKGMASQPFFTPEGIHILKVMDREETAAYENVSARLMERLRRKEILDKGTGAVLERLKKAWQYAPNQAAMEELLAKGRTEQTLFTIDGQAYTGTMFTHFASSHPQAVKRQLEGFIAKSLLDYESRNIDKKHPEIPYALRESDENYLVEEITRQKIDLPAANDRAGLATYFKFHSSDYRWESPRYRGVVLHCVDKKTAKQAKKMLKKVPEKEWADKLRQTFNTSGEEKIQVEQGIFADGDNKYIDKLVFKKGDFDPLMSYPFTIVVGEKMKGPDDYREVIDRVRKDYRSYLDTCWMRELSESGKVEINQEVLKTVNNN